MSVCTMQRKHLKPLQEALAVMRAPPPEVALHPEAAWRPLQRVLDAVHAQLRCASGDLADCNLKGYFINFFLVYLFFF